MYIYVILFKKKKNKSIEKLEVGFKDSVRNRKRLGNVIFLEENGGWGGLLMGRNCFGWRDFFF